MLGREIQVGESGPPDYVGDWHKADITTVMINVRLSARADEVIE